MMEKDTAIQVEEDAASVTASLSPEWREEDHATLVEMTKAGVLYGHKKSRKNPNFNNWVFSVRGGVEVIDLEKTLTAIEEVATFLKKELLEKKTFLVVGTQPAAQEAVKMISEALAGCPYVVNRWIGGLLTNFSVLSRRIEYYKKRTSDFKDGKFDNYTKKEKLLISREIEKMDTMFSGVKELTKLPDIMIVIDGSLKSHRAAIAEAKLKKISLVGIIDNDDEPKDFAYFIPANDHARSSVEWVMQRVIEKIKS